MESALALDRVCKRYGAFEAVHDLSFEVEKGTICGFLGPNGAGKTSTLRIILGLQAATTGRVEILGSKDGRRVRNRIGFLPEERGLYKKMTPVDAIVFFGGLKGLPMADGRKRALTMLEEHSLATFCNRKMKDLSKGMAQKVQLLASIVHRPEFVILDEPFSGLDPINQSGLENMIRNLAAQGTTVLFSTHIMEHAERLCEKVVLLGRGRKVFEGTVTEACGTSPRFLELEGVIDATSIANLPGVAGVEILAEADGVRKFRAALSSEATGQDTLKAAFLGGLNVRRFELHRASLHDAFIALTSQGSDRVPGSSSSRH